MTYIYILSVRVYITLKREIETGFIIYIMPKRSYVLAIIVILALK